MAEKVAEYLRVLTAYPDRHVGGPGNRAATRFFAETVAAFGLEVRARAFDCLEWEFGEASVSAGGASFAANVGPYSHPFAGTARLAAASSVEEIEGAPLEGAALLLHGDIAAHQLMPKNFTWYNPESHQRIIRAIEAAGPAVVIAATGTDPEMVGGQYPFPLFEDGDFEIPNAYLRDTDGERLLAHVGEPVEVAIDSQRIPATAEHVTAWLPGIGEGRIVLSAHIDSRKGSPGALDNASGVATLLAVAELLDGYAGPPSIEFVPFNGEDNYANPGEMLWAAENEGRLGDVVLNINVDDSGQRGAINHVSFYGCPEPIESAVRRAMEGRTDVAEGPQWQQGDHMILVMAGRPAIAIASADMHRFMAEYAHTERDSIELADPALIASTADFIAEVVRAVGAG